MRLLWATLLLLAAVAAAFILLALYLRSHLFFPDRYPIGRWDIQQFGVVPREYTFATPDGERLHAWLFRAKDADAPLVLWFHGNAGNLTNRAEMGVELARRGVSTLIFDYRGFGKSTGTPSESKIYRDALAAYDFAKTLGSPRIVLYGESIGGPYAAYVARERKGPSGVILENSFSSLADLANALYAPLPLGWLAPRAMRTSAWLNEAGLPVLVMHGKRDAVIPYSIGKKLYDDLRVPKTMLTSETAGHCELPFAEPVRYYDAVVGFSKEDVQ